MIRLPHFWKRLLFFFHRARLEKDLAEELETPRSLLESKLTFGSHYAHSFATRGEEWLPRIQLSCPRQVHSCL